MTSLLIDKKSEAGRDFIELYNKKIYAAYGEMEFNYKDYSVSEDVGKAIGKYITSTYIPSMNNSRYRKWKILFGDESKLNTLSTHGNTIIASDVFETLIDDIYYGINKKHIKSLSEDNMREALKFSIMVLEGCILNFWMIPVSISIKQQNKLWKTPMIKVECVDETDANRFGYRVILDMFKWNEK